MQISQILQMFTLIRAIREIRCSVVVSPYCPSIRNPELCIAYDELRIGFLPPKMLRPLYENQNHHAKKRMSFLLKNGTQSKQKAKFSLSFPSFCLFLQPMPTLRRVGVVTLRVNIRETLCLFLCFET